MSNLTITNNDLGSVTLKQGEFKDDTLTVGGAVTIKEGTILARDSVSLKLVPFVIGGSTNENGIPKAIITYEITSTGAGDLSIRPMLGGVVRFDKLVIDADGDNSNVDAAVLDQMRDYAQITVDVRQVSYLDNQ